MVASPSPHGSIAASLLSKVLYVAQISWGTNPRGNSLSMAYVKSRCLEALLT